MRLALCLVIFAGCSFKASSGSQDSPTGGDGRASDAPKVDAPSDAAVAVCKLRAKPTTLRLGSRVGGNGGGAASDLACPANEFPIGYGFDISDNNTEFGGRSAHKVTQQCASLQLHNAELTAGALSPVVTKAGSGVARWTPATATAVVTCPANTIMVGLKAFTGTTGLLFANISIKCRAITAADIFGPDQLVAIPNTSNLNQGADEGTCNNDEVLAFMEVRSGAGIDSLQLQCVQLECAP